MASYKSILDGLLDSVSNIVVARIRTLKQTYNDSSLNRLPASSDTKLSLLGAKQFQTLANQVEQFMQKLLNEFNQELEEQYKHSINKQYQRPLTGTNGQECQREQIKEEQEKGLVIMFHNKQQDDGETTLKFNHLKDFLYYDSKKAKQVQNLSIEFKSQGMTDNNMEHFMKKFIQFYNIEHLKLNLGCNSLTVVGARQLAGCFTNLNRLSFMDVSLYNNKITWEGIDALMHAFKHLYNLKDLNLDVSCNPIGNKGFVIVSKALPEMRRLRKLWLSAYDIGVNDESFKIFINEFTKLPPLLIAKFDFKVNPFNKKLTQELQKIIHEKKINNYEILV
ncbi:unnamed protein product [Paramecium octaurelia]|uniref:Uncharacterized protein n=1 Tax=Paramecium octaurelia TaxID=43137 RepID=A0A8S1W2I6_PAROT|nr:unnamed protein product [Paramecium octaurelia]